MAYARPAVRDGEGVRVVRHAPLPHVAVIVVEGELDLASAPRLKWALSETIAAGEGPRQVIVDLTRLDFIDSTAIGVLVGAAHRSGEEVSLLIACDRESVLHIFEVTGLDAGFAIFPTVKQALAFCGGGDA